MPNSDANGSSRIFISYRRDETAYPASWLYDRLQGEFGGAQIFKDVDNIKPGDDFVDTITRAVGSCDVLLAVIGPHWTSALDKRGQRRIDDPGDFVRLEVETALSRNVRVIPLLVDHADMPDGSELPEPLAPLVRKHALALSPSNFVRDAEELVKVLRHALTPAATVFRAPEPTRAPPSWPPAGPTPAHPVKRPRGWRNPLGWISGQRWLRSALVGTCCLLVVTGLIVVATRTSEQEITGGPADEGFSLPPMTLPKSDEPMPPDELIWRRKHGKEDFRIERIDLQGRVRQTLTTERNRRMGMLTPDRRTLLYLHQPEGKGGQITLRAKSVDGQIDRDLFSDQSSSCRVLGRPAIRADGLLAAVCRDYVDGPGTLKLMSLDGKILRELAQGYVGGPTFTRDGRSVVYWRASSPGLERGALFKVTWASEPETVKITHGAEDSEPVSSPNSDDIAFRREVGDGSVIAVVNPSSGPNGARELPSTGNNDFGPSWSPDGSQIAFARGPEEAATPWVMRADGKDQRKLRNNDGKYASAPIWTAH